MKKNDFQQIAANLKATRLQFGFSQEDVAKKLNVSQSYVSRCETGGRRINVFDLERFADLYEKSISDLLTTKDEER